MFLDSTDALIISCGYQSTHLVPVLGGQFQSSKCRRINLGGAQIDAFMQRILQLKYPGHLNALTLSRAEVNTFYDHILHFGYLNLDKEICKLWDCANVKNVVQQCSVTCISQNFL